MSAIIFSLIAIALASDCTLGKIEGCTICEYTETMEKCATCTPLSGFATKPNKDGKCDKCIDNCLSCEGDLKKCDKNKGTVSPNYNCKDGYGYIDSTPDESDETKKVYKCEQCKVTNCMTCDDDNEKKCTVCERGYYKVEGTGEAADTCTKCNVQNCEACLSKDTCIVCADGHLNSDTCPSCTDANCKHCSAEGANKCTECNNGYSLKSDSTCVKCDEHCSVSGCSTQGEGKCDTTCQSGYYLTAEKECAECEVEHCISCSTSDPKKCISGSCEKGYYRDSEGQCKECTEHCNTCDDSSNGADGKCDDTKTVLGVLKGCEAGYKKNEHDGKCYYTAELATSGCAKSNKTEGGDNNSGHVCLECDGGLDFQDDGKLCAESSSYMTTILFALVVLVAIF